MGKGCSKQKLCFQNRIIKLDGAFENEVQLPDLCRANEKLKYINEGHIQMPPSAQCVLVR